MSIPTIEPYPMPTESQLPTGLVGWRPDAGRAALLIHDMQRYFVSHFPPGGSPREPLIANIVRLRALARSLGLPVLYTVQPGRMTRAERGLLHDVWGPGMTDDPESRDIVPELTPGPGEAVVTKYRYSGFHRTELATRLAAAGRDQLIVCGVFAHIGCLFTAADAFSHDIQPFLVADAMADFSLRDHLLAIDYVARRCAVTTVTDRLAGMLAPAPDRAAGPGRRVPPATRCAASGRSAGGDS
jgi:trans-2,3-dihydro-3-hydroxyanthranilic acid synthase